MVYEFEGLQLDPARRRLSRGDEEVPLTPKPLDVLIRLVEQRDRVVEKQALIEAVWPRVVVEDNSLERCISALRRALGESAGENRFIATIPGRGYRFVAPVAAVHADRTFSPHGCRCQIRSMGLMVSPTVPTAGR
jgi:DNA-binding winged helix-turn-helix (wHTH) protein